MAGWTASGLFGQTIADLFENTTALDYNADTFKLALFDNTVTPDFDAAAASVAFNAGTWLTSAEVTGTGWSSGGVALTTPTLTVGSPAAGQLKFDTDDVSETGTTLSSIYGCFVYDDTITTPVADQGIFAVYFSGAPYTTTTGTLTITVDTNGWYYIDYTP